MEKRLHLLKCEEGSNMCAYLDHLIDLQDQLTYADVDIDNISFQCIINMSIPTSYKPIIAAIHAAYWVTPNTKLTSSTLINTLCKEYNNHSIDARAKKSESAHYTDSP